MYVSLLWYQRGIYAGESRLRMMNTDKMTILTKWKCNEKQSEPNECNDHPIIVNGRIKVRTSLKMQCMTLSSSEMICISKKYLIFFFCITTCFNSLQLYHPLFSQTVPQICNGFRIRINRVHETLHLVIACIYSEAMDPNHWMSALLQFRRSQSREQSTNKGEFALNWK